MKQKDQSNSRIISALFPLKEYRRIIIFVLMGGIALFIALNLIYQAMLPQLLQKLVLFPSDGQSYFTLLTNTRNMSIWDDVRSLPDNMELSGTIEEATIKVNALNSQIRDTEKVIKAAPLYPDGYAYLALLRAQNRECKAAEEAVTKAILLDPNREEFAALKEYINSCR